MKKLWGIIKEKWLIYWQDDEYDISKKHLSQSDKRSLLYGGFMISMMVMIAFSAVNAINNHKATKGMEAFLNTVFTYMATATDDEYEEIAQTIRHDLIYSPYREDIENLIQYIPNTAESCCLEQKSYPTRINLVFPNTGELYGLDIYEKDEIPEEKALYPVEEGELQIGNYLLQIEYETGNYEIEIAYTGE